jgi:hypothetical protein
MRVAHYGAGAAGAPAAIVTSAGVMNDSDSTSALIDRFLESFNSGALGAMRVRRWPTTRSRSSLDPMGTWCGWTAPTCTSPGFGRWI